MSGRHADAVTDDAAIREHLWGAVLDGDEYAACATVFAAVDAGLPVEDVLLEVIAPVQRRIGGEWAANRITVAQEHAATAINDRVIAALAHHPAGRRDAASGRVTVACVDGEWHALPARLLSEVLRLRGWRVDFLGAQVPTPRLIAHLHQYAPAAVALSCSIPTRLPTAHAAITACQAAGVPVLVGGAAFGFDGRYAQLLRADAWAPDARSAAQLLADGFPTSGHAAAHQPIDDLPHLADQEYTYVRRASARLVEATLLGTGDHHSVEDVVHIVDYLATALYIDDDELFTGYLVWTGDILAARGHPAAELRPVLDTLEFQLRDFPRSCRLLQAARAALTSTTDPEQIA